MLHVTCSELPGDPTMPTRLLCPGISQARILEWLPFPSPGGLFDPEIEPRPLALQADCSLTEPRGKPWNGQQEV